MNQKENDMTSKSLEVRGNSTFTGMTQRVIRKVLKHLAVHQNVEVGKNFRVGRSVVISSPHGLKIGNNVSIGPHTTIQVNGSIGDFTLIGMYVQIAGRSDHAIDEVGLPYSRSTWVGERAPSERDKVVIGRDVWVGGHATILSGVSIGDGALIGAASVVTKDVAPFAIVAGNPATFIGWRFEGPQQSAHLEALRNLAKQD